MTRSGNDELWNQARATMERIASGKLSATPAQIDKLRKLLEAHEAWAYADIQVKRAAIGLYYERQAYLSRLWFLERLGAQNQWGHALLVEIKAVLYAETDEFKLDDFMAPTT